ncbi:hypothetical protein DRJ48_00790 [Candidatus Woesearchaeota archaeon]|nr:hypothetical protein [Candidatus Woesearchaeota archaeon]RLE43478.1 MAG: hypothetical protein DRJ48_00790 [Candidatus Woesearchaeota archaeon]
MVLIPKSVLIIYCPLSGPRHSAENLKRVRKPLERLLSENGIEFRYEDRLLPYDAIKRYGQDYPFDILLGGDSALKYMVQGMVEEGLNEGGLIAQFKFGSGNDFLSANGISSIDDTFEALRGFFSQPDEFSRRVDLLAAKIDDTQRVEYGTFMIGFGLSANIAYRTSFRMKKHLPGQFAYKTAVYRTLVQDYWGLKTRVKVSTNRGEELEAELISLMVCNGPYAGAGMMPVPWAEIDDGVLNLFGVDMMNPVRLARVFDRVYDGSHVELKECHFLDGESFEIEFEKGLLTQIDGEVIKKGGRPVKPHKVEVQVLPKALSCIYLPTKQRHATQSYPPQKARNANKPRFDRRRF